MKRLIKLLLILLAVIVYMKLTADPSGVVVLPFMVGYTAGDTGFAVDDAETVNRWENIVRKAPQLDFFFANKFVGADPNSIIQTTEKVKGGLLTLTLVDELENDGTTIETDLEGKEEQMGFHSMTMAATKYENAVRGENEISFYRAAFELRNEMKDALTRWRDNLNESLMVDAIYTSPDSVLDITGETSSTMTAAALEWLLLAAITKEPKIPPVMINGKEWYVVLISPFQARDLRQDETFMNGLISANAPGYNDNPLWVKADYRWNGLMVYVYDRVPLATGSVAKAILLGRQAAAFGVIPGCNWDWKEYFKDKAERIPAVDTRVIQAVKKCTFNSIDFATKELWTTYTPLPS